jgi:hypothetical protein
MAARPRLAALGVAAALLVALDVTIARINVFRPLIPIRDRRRSSPQSTSS